jgi:hypothetical protein
MASAPFPPRVLMDPRRFWRTAPPVPRMLPRVNESFSKLSRCVRPAAIADGPRCLAQQDSTTPPSAESNSTDHRSGYTPLTSPIRWPQSLGARARSPCLVHRSPATSRPRHSVAAVARVFHSAGPAASETRSEGHEAAARPVRRSSHLSALSLRCRPEEAAQNRGARRLRTRLAATTAPVRARPDRRRPRPIRRRRCPRPGEEGRRHVEPRTKGVAATLRSRGGARPPRLHRRRTRIQLQMPNAEQRASPCRCPVAIQIEMLASTAGRGHLASDAGVAVQ